MAGHASAAGEFRAARAAFHVPLRVQYGLLIGSALVLAVTGLPQRLDSLAPSQWLMDAAGGIETLRTVHHAAGAALIVVALYHAFSAFLVPGIRRAAPLAMIPDARDYRDACTLLLYFVGRRQQRPPLRDPSYFKKADYWVLAWGFTAMGLSGLIRLFPARMTGILSGDVVAATLEFHSDVALLAVVWLVVVHLAYGTLLPHRSSKETRPAIDEGSAGGEE